MMKKKVDVIKFGLISPHLKLSIVNKFKMLQLQQTMTQ